MYKFLLFAGTTEGRQIAEHLAASEQAQSKVFVATDYGKELVLEGVSRLIGDSASSSRFSCMDVRMNETEMEHVMEEFQPDLVIDATHPYAREATANIMIACQVKRKRYLRVLREEGSSPSGNDPLVTVADMTGAVNYLQSTQGNILLATGSKELPAFTALTNFSERVFPRILPSPGAVERCIALGFSPKNIICMQGPFSEELNTAMLRQIQGKYLVTKDSGEIGGFSAKLSAAEAAGAEVVMVKRPEQPGGVSLAQLFSYLTKNFGLPERRVSQQISSEADMESAEAVPAMFPLFISLSGKKIKVIGGGRIALRRIQTLLLFADRVTVVATHLSCEICELAAQYSGRLFLECRPFRSGECRDEDLVLAATDSREVNHQIYEECRELGIPVNTADCQDECSFYFPGVVKRGALVVGVTASGTNHQLAARTVKKIRETIAVE